MRNLKVLCVKHALQCVFLRTLVCPQDLVVKCNSIICPHVWMNRLNVGQKQIKQMGVKHPIITFRIIIITIMRYFNLTRIIPDDISQGFQCHFYICEACLIGFCFDTTGSQSHERVEVLGLGTQKIQQFQCQMLGILKIYKGNRINFISKIKKIVSAWLAGCVHLYLHSRFLQSKTIYNNGFRNRYRF